MKKERIMIDQNLADIKAKKQIGIYYLKPIWDYYQTLKHNPSKAIPVEWKYVNGVFNALGIGTEPTLKYLMNFNDTFEAFED